MPRRPRIFYIGNVGSSSLSRRWGQDHYVGAADRKVMAVAKALRDEHYGMVVVSSALNAPPGDARRTRAVRADGVPYVRLWAFGRAGLRRLTSALSMLRFGMGVVRRQDRVLLYNLMPDYILLALWLWMTGQPAILDIEDGPTGQYRGPRGLIWRLSYEIVRTVSARRYVVASRALADELALDVVLPVYGVAAQGTTPASGRFAASRVQVLLGGSVLPETGSELFIGAVRILSASGRGSELDLHVTGRFDLEQFEALQHEVSGRGLNIRLHASLDAEAYDALLARCDVGLCLKLSHHIMGRTTFPSKVIEIASAGLLVCSTPVSDVPLVFDDTTAILLERETPDELADALAGLDGARDRYRAIAQAGRLRVGEVCAPARVAQSLGEFLLAPL